MSKGPRPVCRAAIPKGRFYTCSDRCAQIRAGLGPFTVPTVTDEELRAVHHELRETIEARGPRRRARGER